MMNLQPKKFLNKKVARRFVMAVGMMVCASRRYLQNTGARRETHPLRDKAPMFWEMTMRKTILTTMGAALIAASAMQAAAAAEHHRSHRAARAPVSTTEQFRNSNAAWPGATVQGPRFNDEALAPPAGR
jgi:hypothetical protein